jgi:hypothetical protein
MLTARSLTLLAVGLGASLAVAAPSTDLVAATRLPIQAQQLRDAGVPDSEVAVAVTAAESAGLPASEATEVLEAESEARGKHGRIDNFGSFVKAQIKEGKPDHAGQGKSGDNGKPEKAGKGKGKNR